MLEVWASPLVPRHWRGLLVLQWKQQQGFIPQHIHALLFTLPGVESKVFAMPCARLAMCSSLLLNFVYRSSDTPGNALKSFIDLTHQHSSWPAPIQVLTWALYSRTHLWSHLLRCHLLSFPEAGWRQITCVQYCNMCRYHLQTQP